MKRKKVKKILAVMLLMTSFTSVTAYAIPEVSDSQLQEKEGLEKQYNENEEKILNLEGEIQKIDNDLSILTLQIQDTEEELKNTQETLKTEEEKLKQYIELMDNRVREMYKNKTTSASYLEFFLESEDLSELMSRISCATKLVETDEKTVDEIQESKEKIQDSKETQESLKNVQKQQQKDLDEKKTESAGKMKELVEIRNKTAESIKNNEAEMVKPLVLMATNSNSISELNEIVSALQKLKKVVKGADVLKTIDITIEEAKLKISKLTSAVEKATNTTNVAAPIDTTNAVVLEAYKYLGIPYLWGGELPSTGMDCSGFVKYVYKQLGISLSRTTYTQVKEGTEVEVSLDKLKSGDLIFFGDKSEPHHVAIYIGNNMYIHAPQTGDVIKISSGALRACTARRIINDETKLNRAK